MPIRLNLLAEAQAAEELRRRDPVKRAALVAGALVIMMLVWISSLQVKIMADNSQLANLQSTLYSHTNEYNKVMENKRRLEDVDDRLLSLNHLAAARFLEAPLLNALMHSTVDGIQITHLRTEQTFDINQEVKAPSERGHIGVSRPATSVEKNKLVLDAKDTSPNPGSEQINRFKETLAHSPYFIAQQMTTNNIQLKNLSPPQLDVESGKPYVLFSLECRYPEKTR